MSSIFYQDNNLLIVDKPAGWLSVPGREGRNEQRDCLSFWLEERLKLRIFPCHRLDKEVSGVIIYAKNEETHRLLNIGFEKHRIFKTYQALSSNVSSPLNAPFEWKNLLVKGKKRAFEASHGKESITKCSEVQKVQYNDQDVLSFILHPITGRSHQLRVHMSMHGHPIIGDNLYGSNMGFKDNEIALRAFRIDFPEDISLKLKIPSHFQIEKIVETQK